MRRLALMIIGLGAELEDLGSRIVGIGEWLLPPAQPTPTALYHSNGEVDRMTEHPTFGVPRE